MAGVTASIQFEPGARKRLEKMDPGKNRSIMRAILVDCALLVQENAADRQIAAGGGGINAAAPPLPNRLTSRTGHLRNSIGVDRGELPHAVTVGTRVVYGGIHEFGLGRYPERPFMRPALKAQRRKFPAVIKRNWRQYGGVR
jgi:hypothetical protein